MLSLIKEIRERLTLFESSLPSRVDGFALCQESKLPWKALCYRESLIWRIVELGQVALECFETKKIASAILLTRAAMETCAALCYLSGKLKTTIQPKSVGDIDDYLMKLLMVQKSIWTSCLQLLM